MYIDGKMRVEISVCGVLAAAMMYILVHYLSEIICFSEEYNEWEGEITGIIRGHDLQFNSRSPSLTM
jgi:hypothetical protein